MKHTKKISFQEEKAPLLRKEGLGVVKKSSLKSWKWLCYLLLFSLASCKSCKKEVNPLPPETQTGANTFGCLIDGQPWIPDGGKGFSSGKPIIGGYIGDRICHLTKYNVLLFTSKSDRTILEIYIKNVTNTGRYLLNKNTVTDTQSCNPENYALYMVDSKTINDPDYNYITTSEYVGFVDITRADTLNRIVSGTFEFEAIDKPSGKKIKVTQGRFDINTKTL